MIKQLIDIQLENYFDTWSLYPIGDLHKGHVGHDKFKLRKVVKEIEDNPNARWIGMGDYGEYIDWLDKRFDPDTVDKDMRVFEFKDIAQALNQRIIKDLEPIKDKCIGLLRGNHEKVYTDRKSFDPANDLAERFNVKYLGYESMTRISVKGPDGKRRYSLVVFAHHGFGGGKKPGSHANNMLDMVTGYEADLYILNHNHRIITMKSVRQHLNSSGNLVNKVQAFINGGSFLNMKQDGIEGYEVKKGLLPLPVGCPHVNISCDWKHSTANMELVA